MAGETQISIIGNIVRPELRFTANGKAVFIFAVADTPRKNEGDSWIDGITTWWDCSVWGMSAEHASESFNQGDRVVVVGRVRTETWTDKDSGKERSKLKIDVDELAASTKFRQVKIVRADREQQGQPAQAAAKPVQDPWAAGFADNPPF